MPLTVHVNMSVDVDVPRLTLTLGLAAIVSSTIRVILILITPMPGGQSLAHLHADSVFERAPMRPAQHLRVSHVLFGRAATARL